MMRLLILEKSVMKFNLKRSGCLCLSLLLLKISTPPSYAQDRVADLSDHYQILIKEESELGRSLLTADQIKHLKKYRILFVPGLLGNIYLKTGILEYFSDQMNWLKSALHFQEKKDYEIVGIHTQRSIKDNVPIILKAIKDSDRPVIIIGHSKGGLDSFTTLLDHPEIQSKVAGFITLQTPFKGSPVADDISDSYVCRNTSKFLLTALSGQGASLDDLMTSHRQAHIHHIKETGELDHLLKNVAIINVATSVSNHNAQGPTDLNSLLTELPFMRSMSKQKIDNDGLVPVENALIDSHVDHVVIDGLDHIDAISSNFRITKTKKYDRVTSFKALLHLLLESILANKV
jgi:triacylglycerol esterase/lipase EstA (alpha/beta hydrolase family)